MSIQELGSIGEFVSAFAVFATLIYLAIQTRLIRKAAEETARFSLARPLLDKRDTAALVLRPLCRKLPVLCDLLQI